MLTYSFFDTPIATVYAGFSAKRICMVSLTTASPEDFELALLKLKSEKPVRDDMHAPALAKTFKAYFSGAKPVWAFDIDLDALTDFQKSVLTETMKIPYGETRTYGEIAEALGKKSGQTARAVGQALNRNPIPIIIPCHRVIAAGGRLGGFGMGTAMKQKLLAIESNPFG